MQEQTHSSGLYRLLAMPLALLAQGTDPTVSDPGCVKYPQRAIMLDALLNRVQGLASWTKDVFLRVGGQSPFPRSDQLCREWRWRAAHTPVREQPHLQSAL